MENESVRHTLSIFQRIYDMLPPLVPQQLRDEMKRKIDEAMADGELSLYELEDIMIAYGKLAWPYMRAFEDIYQVYEDKMAEKLLAQRASNGVRKKYELLKSMGGEFRDLYHGRVTHLFEHKEQQELGGLLVDLKHDIRRHAMNATTSHDKEHYQDKVEKYGKMIADVNNVLDDLKSIAQETQHKGLSRDVHDKVRAIEYGFSFLGPQISFQEIYILKDHFKGRSDEIKYNL